MCLPSLQWLAQFLARTSSVLPRAQPEHIARILWGLAALGAHPPRQWMMRVYRQTLVQVLIGCQMWKPMCARFCIPCVETPSYGTITSLHTRSHISRCHHVRPTAGQNTSILGEIDVSSAMSQWLLCMPYLLQAFEFDAQSFSNTFWAAARLGAPPPKVCAWPDVVVKHVVLNWTSSGRGLLMGPCLW
jgi:hypothetical protein